MATPAVLFSASDLERLLEPRALLGELRNAMIAHDADPTRGLRAHSHIPAATPHSVSIVFPGLVPGIPAYTVKLNAKRPGATPYVRGLIALLDLETGALLSVMDSVVITRLRTALVGALSAEALSRPRIRSVAVVGAGVQGRAQLRALKLVRNFESVRVFDSVSANADAMAVELDGELGASLSVASSARAAVDGADVVIVATWARSPVIRDDMIAPGTHITAVGADEPGKAELDAALIRRARFVCDDIGLAASMGALAGAGLGADAAHATLGAVLAGRAAGRTDDEQVTVFGSVGLPCQDLPAAWMAWRRARTERSATFSFHAT